MYLVALCVGFVLGFLLAALIVAGRDPGVDDERKGWH
jgi:hypothetical protein